MKKEVVEEDLEGLISNGDEEEFAAKTCLLKGMENEIEEIATETKMMDFEGPLFDEQVNEDEDVILEEIQRINSLFEVELEKVEEIAVEESLCECLKILIAKEEGEEKL